MKIEFSKDLSEQKIYAVGIELATVMGQDKDKEGKRIYAHPETQQELVTTLENPILMTDRYKIMQISDYKTRIATEILQSKAERILEYDGFSMKWNNSNQYPWMRFPSIDTVFFCSCLQQIDLSQTKKIIEIWSGPGFIGKYIKHSYPSIEKLILNDINPSALEYFNETNTDPQTQFILKDGKQVLQQETFDLIVSNPPYIPRPQSIDDNPYEGLSLVIDMITNLKNNLNPGGSMILVLPNLAEEVLQPFINSNEIIMEELGSKEVPLKVSNILMNKEWLEYLIQHKGLKQEYKLGYEYWQTIKVYKFSIKD